MTSKSVTRKAVTPYARLVKVFKFSKLSRAALAGLSAQRLRDWQLWARDLEKGIWLRDGGTSDLPTLDELSQLAERSRQALRWTVRGNNWPVSSAELYVSESGAVHYVAKSREATFLHGVAEILGAARSSLRQCKREGCSEIFVALRRGMFCSAKCAQRARARRSRDQRMIKHLTDEGWTDAEATEIVEKRRAARVAEHNARLELADGYDPDAPPRPLTDPETVRVEGTETTVGYNSDFDPAKCQLFEEQAKPKVAAYRRRHNPKPVQPRRAVIH
jgi:hypothetical protein